MSGKIKLGKSRDSRTRGKTKTQDAAALSNLQQELKEQKGFTDYLLVKGYSSNTIKRFVKDTTHFLQWIIKENIPVEQVSYNDVLHYVQGKRGQVKQKTIATHVSSLKHYFAYLVTTEKLADNPVTQVQIKGIKRKILYDILKKSELENLYQNFEQSKSGNLDKNHNWFMVSVQVSFRNRIIIGLMVYQGLTVGELSKLTLQDIKLREGRIYIAGSRRSNERELKLEAHQMLDLMEYTLKIRTEILQQSKKQSDRLFIGTGGSENFNGLMEHLINKLKKQNSKVSSAKQIRTSVITHWLKLYNLRQVQHMAGHRFVSSTEAYLVNDLEDLQEDVGKYHPIG